jgi:DcmR-like sensory protein
LLSFKFDQSGVYAEGMNVSPELGSSQGEAKIFWGEIAPCEHVAQFYKSDSALNESLARFAAAGLEAGESVILVATPEHLRELTSRLNERGLDIRLAIAEDRYINSTVFRKPNPASGVPIYVQLREQIRHAIETGALMPGDPARRHPQPC